MKHWVYCGWKLIVLTSVSVIWLCYLCKSRSFTSNEPPALDFRETLEWIQQIRFYIVCVFRIALIQLRGNDNRVFYMSAHPPDFLKEIILLLAIELKFKYIQVKYTQSQSFTTPHISCYGRFHVCHGLSPCTGCTSPCAQSFLVWLQATCDPQYRIKRYRRMSEWVHFMC